MSDIKSYRSKSRSISSSQILPCNYNFDEAKLIMREMIQNGCYELYKQGYVTDLFQIFVGYGDKKEGNAKGGTRMSVTTNLYSIISNYAEKLFDQIVDKNRPVRKIGYNFADLLPQDNEQFDLFTDISHVEKEKRLVESILSVQDKYGKNSILKGLDLEEKATQRERNASIGGHKSGES